MSHSSPWCVLGSLNCLGGDGCCCFTVCVMFVNVVAIALDAFIGRPTLARVVGIIEWEIIS